MAHASGTLVLHLFILDPRWYGKTKLGGFPRTGPVRAQFQLEALRDLSARLECAGHSLCVRRGISTERAFEELCNEYEVATVYASNEVCTEELRVEDRVRETLKRKSAGPLKLFWTYELHHHADLPEQVRKKGASGFSGYRRTFADQCTVRPPLPQPNFTNSVPGARWARAEGLPASLIELGLEDTVPRCDERAEIKWQGGETSALAHLRDLFFATDAIAVDFTGATNFPHDGHSSTKDGAGTKLSPWLAHGCISPRFVFAELKRYERERHKSDSTARLVHELYFRDFVRFSSLVKGSKIFKLEGIYNRHPPGGWLQDSQLLKPWYFGETGFPFLDAAMRELKATGHCSHSGREVAAWFLVCDLGIDWRLGAEWFESNLIDYEPASNYFNWTFTIVPRATGGNAIQEEAKPLRPPRTRLQTLEVIYWAAQSDPDAEYIKRWVPELRSLSGPMAREPWRNTDADADVAERVDGRAQERPPPVSKERERIGWARRTFPAGGSDIVVWWGCVQPSWAGEKPASSGHSAAEHTAAIPRIDPEDGNAYTLSQLRGKYKGTYSIAEIESYWQDVCKSSREEIKIYPADGKAYTLSELEAKYQKSYSKQQVASYFKSDCTMVGNDNAAGGYPSKQPATLKETNVTRKEIGTANNTTAPAGWPAGYPLPLLPPASFYCIEDIAEHSRRAQARKTANAAKLRQNLGSTRAPLKQGDTSYAKQTEDASIEKTKRKGRWARVEGP